MLRDSDSIDETPARRGPGRPTRSNAELLDLSIELFFENGFERTSIDAICAAAGMAKRTVYARYGDKDRLFKAALKRAIEQWIVPIERLRAAESADLEETLLAIARILIANLIGPGGLRLLRLTNAESGRMPDIGAYAVKHGTEPTLVYLAEIFRRQLGFDAKGAEDAAIAFLRLVVGGAGTDAAWGVPEDTETLERRTRYSVGLFLRGILPRGAGTAAAADVEAENLRLKKLLAESMIALDQARGG